MIWLPNTKFVFLSVIFFFISFLFFLFPMLWRKRVSADGTVIMIKYFIYDNCKKQPR